MSGMDFGELAKQAAKMQEDLQKMQAEAESEIVTASAGGGMVKVTATAARSQRERQQHEQRGQDDVTRTGHDRRYAPPTRPVWPGGVGSTEPPKAQAPA